MKKSIPSTIKLGLSLVLTFLLCNPSQSQNSHVKATNGGEMTFTVRTVSAGGNYSPKHVLAIWVEDADGFVKTRKAMANQRKQYLYTWKAASNYNVVDAITGSTLTSHQTHTVTWDCLDLDGNLVPDGDYTVWIEFTDKHAQGPLYTIPFTKGPSTISLTPPDETYFKDIAFDFEPYIADFTLDETDICQFKTINFTDASTNAESWFWEFGEGATPMTAATEGPHIVQYSTVGPKTVSLTVNGSVTETKEDIIMVSIEPEADFDFSGLEYTIEFTNNSLNALTYLWDFGDGNTSTDSNPVHTYAEAGSYAVELTALNEDCDDIQSQTVEVPLVGINQFDLKDHFQVYPNPTNGQLTIGWPLSKVSKGTLTIYNARGNIIDERELDSSNDPCFTTLDISDQSKGLYFIQFQNADLHFSGKVLLK